MDIELLESGHVKMKKQLWHESEILLARCFNFDIDVETGTIHAEIKVTAKRALFEFIKLAFKNFTESPLEENRRNRFYQDLSVFYKKYDDFVMNEIATKLPYGDKFYAHQSETIRFAYYKQYNFLALDRRLGKTIISASLSRLWNCKRTIIVTTSTAKWNAWFRDLTKKFGFNELYFTIWDTRKSYRLKAFSERFVVINYDIVEKFMSELSDSNVDHFIFDEAQKIKTRTAGRTKAIKKLVNLFPEAKVTFLSGTPITNRVNDVYSYLNLIGHELGHNYKKFCDEFTMQTTFRGNSKVGAGKNLQDLRIKLLNFMIRKRKEDCLDVPNQTFTSYKFELDDYRAEYDNVIKELSEQKEISALSGNIHSLNILTSKAKIKGIIELAEDIIEDGGKVVLFSNYTAPIEMLENHFKDRCVKITGSVDAYKRDQIVERFRTDENVPVFLGNMQSAGEAINLAIANEIIVVDFPLVPGTLFQAIDRCIEIGKKEDVNVNYTFCDESIDHYIYSLLMDKSADINILIDDGKNDVMQNGNMVEKLIKMLLKRDDVSFKNNSSKLVAQLPEAEVEKVEIKDEVKESLFEDLPNFD